MCKKKLIFIIVTLFSYGCASTPIEQEPEPVRLSELEKQGFEITEQKSINDIEEKSAKDMAQAQTSCPKVPFGCLNKEWNNFKSKIKNGDTVIYFKSPKEHWAALYGRAGYAIVRDGILIDSILVTIN